MVDMGLGVALVPSPLLSLSKQRNNIFNSMMFNAYTSWSKNYDDNLKEEASNKVLLELNAYYKNFILKYSKDKKYINV